MTEPGSLAEIDPSLMIFRVNHGIKLVKSELAAYETQAKHGFNTGYSVASLSALHFNFYFLNLKGETLHMNQQCVEICGFQSLSESKGKSLFAVSDSQSASQLIENCNQAIIENKIKIFEEQNIRKDGVALQFLSVKSPWLDDENHCLGIFGCSVVLGQQSLSNSLQQISELGLLNATNVALNNTVIPSISQNNETLSERESLCVFHLCKGFTLKEIAKIIGLSPKTVETYIDRAKIKFNCRNKAELIAAYIKAS